MELSLYVADISELSPNELFFAALNKVSPYRRNKVESITGKKSKLLSLGAGLLLTFALREYGIDETNVKYARDINEKPYLENYPEIQFNLSHSGTKVMCGICNQPMKLGCDVEEVRPINLQIAKRFYHQKETSIIFSEKNISEQEKLFFDFWTAKESFVKALGTGLRTPLNSFYVDLSQKTAYQNNLALPVRFHFFDIPMGEKVGTSGTDPEIYKQLGTDPNHSYRATLCLHSSSLSAPELNTIPNTHLNFSFANHI